MTKEEKRKFPASLAEEVAKELCLYLSPGCKNLAIAGSLRRKKPEVGDVELLAIPERDWKGRSLLDHRVEELIRMGILDHRYTKDGRRASYGEQNKFLIHRETGIPVDIFTCGLSDWGVKLLYRTGPDTFNIKMAQLAISKGMRLRYSIGLVDKSGKVIASRTEKEIFEALGLEYLPPEQRE